ncbi:hypothetical protein TYRP_004150 [Tyrophagus putrescentiae]|nr:hypothetical protein TYRP_004150 [Tyrophagus putrescentiae]
MITRLTRPLAVVDLLRELPATDGGHHHHRRSVILRQWRTALEELGGVGQQHLLAAGAGLAVLHAGWPASSPSGRPASSWASSASLYCGAQSSFSVFNMQSQTKIFQLKSRSISKSKSRIKSISWTTPSNAATVSNVRIISRSRSGGRNRSGSRSRDQIRSRSKSNSDRSKKSRKASDLAKRPQIKTKSANVKINATKEPLTKCSSFVALPKSNLHRHMFISPAFSKLHARLKVSSNLGRNYSVVDLVTRADQQTIRWAFTRTVLTFTLSLLLFTALSLGLVFGLLSEGGTGLISWPGVLISLGLTGVLSLLLSFFAYWTSFDFTALFNGCFLLLLGLVVLVAAVLYGADGENQAVMKTLFDGAVSLCLLFFLAMTTQMIVGGEGRQRAIPRGRYIRAALTLYTEVMALYFYLPGVRLLNRTTAAGAKEVVVVVSSCSPHSLFGHLPEGGRLQGRRHLLHLCGGLLHLGGQRFQAVQLGKGSAVGRLQAADARLSLAAEEEVLAGVAQQQLQRLQEGGGAHRAEDHALGGAAAALQQRRQVEEGVGGGHDQGEALQRREDVLEAATAVHFSLSGSLGLLLLDDLLLLLDDGLDQPGKVEQLRLEGPSAPAGRRGAGGGHCGDGLRREEALLSSHLRPQTLQLFEFEQLQVGEGEELEGAQGGQGVAAAGHQLPHHRLRLLGRQAAVQGPGDDGPRLAQVRVDEVAAALVLIVRVADQPQADVVGDEDLRQLGGEGAAAGHQQQVQLAKALQVLDDEVETGLDVLHAAQRLPLEGERQRLQLRPVGGHLLGNLLQVDRQHLRRSSGLKKMKQK